MNIKKGLLSLLLNETVASFLLDKIFNKTASTNLLDNAFNKVKNQILKLKTKYEKSQNPYDEEVFNLSVNAIKTFAQELNEFLSEIEAA